MKPRFETKDGMSEKCKLFNFCRKHNQNYFKHMLFRFDKCVYLLCLPLEGSDIQ